MKIEKIELEFEDSDGITLDYNNNFVVILSDITRRTFIYQGEEYTDMIANYAHLQFDYSVADKRTSQDRTFIDKLEDADITQIKFIFEKGKNGFHTVEMFGVAWEGEENNMLQITNFEKEYIDVTIGEKLYEW